MSTETISQVAAPAAPAPATPAPGAEQLPTIHQIAAGIEQASNTEPTPPVIETPDTETPPPANEWNQLTEQQRNVFREKERLRKEKIEFDKQKTEQDKRFSSLETVVDEYMGTDPNNQPGQEDFDPDKYKEELRADIMKEVKGYQEEVVTKQKEDEQVTQFKEGVGTFLDEKSADFPLSSSMKQSDLVFEIIQQQYQKDIAEFGQDYATQNMLTKEVAAKKAETHLASEVTKMLQSESVRNYLLNQINTIGKPVDPNKSVNNQLIPGNQSTPSPSTLTNDLAQSTPTTTFVDETIETDEDAFNRALSLVP